MGWQFRYAADQPAMSLDFVLLASQNLNMIIALGILLVGSRKPTSYTYNFLLTGRSTELCQWERLDPPCALPARLRQTGRKPASAQREVSI
jgi:hypothetical protein